MKMTGKIVNWGKFIESLDNIKKVVCGNDVAVTPGDIKAVTLLAFNDDKVMTVYYK